MQQKERTPHLLLQRAGAPYVLSWLVVGLMAAQSVLGLVFSDQYRDVAWITATWFGNDWVTLVLAVPLLATALLLARRGSVRGHLLWLGGHGYGIYNYAFYLFGTSLNVFFPIYVVTLVVAGVALILLLSRLQVGEVAQGFRARTPVRPIGGYFVFVAVGLAAVWTAMWAAYVFGGQPLPVETGEFQLVAALDLTLMVPALAFGGVLLWRRTPWGYVIASIAAIQGALYLLVLSVNSVISINRGFEEAPGQLPIWGTLAIATAAAVVILLGNVRSSAALQEDPVAEEE